MFLHFVVYKLHAAIELSSSGEHSGVVVGFNWSSIVSYDLRGRTACEFIYCRVWRQGVGYNDGMQTRCFVCFVRVLQMLLSPAHWPVFDDVKCLSKSCRFLTPRLLAFSLVAVANVLRATENVGVLITYRVIFCGPFFRKEFSTMGCVMFGILGRDKVPQLMCCVFVSCIMYCVKGNL